MKLSKGFTLVELIIVIAIIGITTGIVTMNFHEWIRKSILERQTKELYGDLNEARLKSIYMKKRHSIVFQPNSYVLQVYSSDNSDRVTGGKQIRSKAVSNLMTKEKGGSLADRIIEFDKRGLTTDWETIRFNPVNSGAGYDCVVVSTGRTNLGQMGSGDVCNQR